MFSPDDTLVRAIHYLPIQLLLPTHKEHAYIVRLQINLKDKRRHSYITEHKQTIKEKVKSQARNKLLENK